MADDKKAPVTDDQELAKVLASMNDQAANTQPGATPAPTPAGPTPNNSGLEENIPPIPATLPTAPAAAPAPAPTPMIQNHGTTPGAPAPVPAPTPTVSVPSAPGSLDDIKRQALDELRPIVSKLDLPAEEKFDALLLVIRSSDDQSLVQAAYQAAEGIADEAKKAQALLDIVKEIEYFSSQGK